MPCSGRIFSSTLVVLFLTSVAGCGMGGNIPSVKVESASSSVTYPQATITATVGQAITVLTPTVTGTVSSYSISPALPAGLSLNTSTGTISGTPTAAAAQATYTVTATTSSGAVTASVQITVSSAAATGLVYPVSQINGIVGQVIEPDTPTVPGTPVSFTFGGVPAPKGVTTVGIVGGLSFNTSTGTISGTPNSVLPGTNFTVTAVTSAGTFTAVVTISVSNPAPTSLAYLLTTITGVVGQAITPDTPTISGAVSSYSVSPALPAGLSLNASTGTISGAPTTVTPQAFYTVTAASSSGSTTAALLLISVIQAPHVLLNLGETGIIESIRMVGDRVISADVNGHWALWNYTTGTLLTSGDGTQPSGYNNSNPVTHPVDMAGPTAVVAGANNLQVISQADGSLLSLIAFQGIDAPPPNPAIPTPPSTWWQLASDGSYICIGSSAGLFVYTPTGQVIVSKAGNYSKAQAFAAPGKVMVALGAAGQTVIETISAATGKSTVSQPFSGTFNSWFADGSHFLTNLNNTVWVYSDSAAERGIVDLPTITGLGGEGNWIWISGLGTYPNYYVNVYAIGATNPALTVSTGNSVDATVVGSGGTVAVLPYGTPQISVVDLSGSTPSQKRYTTPIAYLITYASTSPSQWVVGNWQGALLDGAGLPDADRYFGYGEAFSIAGASNTTAIGTASGKILLFDPYSRMQQETIDFSSSKVMLASDGSVLAALANTTEAQYEEDRTINVYSLPSASLIHSFPDTWKSSSSTNTSVLDFTLAASGTTIGRIIATSTLSPISGAPPQGGITRIVTPITGGPTIWSETNQNQIPILLSLDGTLIADVAGISGPLQYATAIIKNGTVVTAVPGYGVGWIENDELLTNEFGPNPNCTGGLGDLGCSPIEYTGASIFNAAGVQVATSPIPQLTSLLPVNSGWVYSSANNAIYSLTSGQAVWTGSYPSTGTGAVAGDYIVYVSGTNVVVESYQ